MIIENTGFTSVKYLTKAIIGQMIENGYEEIYSFEDSAKYVSILKTTLPSDLALIDNSANSWRIAFIVEGEKISLRISSDQYLTDAGIVDEEYLKPIDQGIQPGFIENFVDRNFLNPEGLSVYPLSYLLSITDHGFFISISDSYNEELQNLESPYTLNPRFSWVLVQRPTDLTGAVKIDGKAPVFCVYSKPVFSESKSSENEISLKFRTEFRQFVVLESDVKRSSYSAPADFSHERFGAILNVENQLSFDQNGIPNITVPFGLNTSRYYYPCSLDMIAYCSADLISELQYVSIKKVSKTYKYIALDSTHLNNTGMRLLVLSEVS